jgi:hypothetical protein
VRLPRPRMRLITLDRFFLENMSAIWSPSFVAEPVRVPSLLASTGRQECLQGKSVLIVRHTQARICFAAEGGSQVSSTCCVTSVRSVRVSVRVSEIFIGFPAVAVAPDKNPVTGFARPAFASIEAVTDVTRFTPGVRGCGAFSRPLTPAVIQRPLGS